MSKSLLVNEDHGECEESIRRRLGLPEVGKKKLTSMVAQRKECQCLLFEHRVRLVSTCPVAAVVGGVVVGGHGSHRQDHAESDH